LSVRQTKNNPASTSKDPNSKVRGGIRIPNCVERSRRSDANRTEVPGMRMGASDFAIDAASGR
jgi:hypothetical protein